MGGYGVGGYGGGAYGGVPDVGPLYKEPIGYYLALITSQYRLSKNFMAWAQAAWQPVDDLTTCVASITGAFTLASITPTPVFPISTIEIAGGVCYLSCSNTLEVRVTGGIPYALSGMTTVPALNGMSVTPSATAENSLAFPYAHATVDLTDETGTATPAPNAQLDILGQLIGVSRTVGFQPSNGVSATLDDATYILLLKARIAWNSWAGTIESLYPIWNSLFSSGRLVINDNQNMTATIIVSGTFTSIIVDLIVNGYIVPRPEGVEYTYVTSELPIFGADQDNAFVAGADLGHAS